jgi:hypothetical protein
MVRTHPTGSTGGLAFISGIVTTIITTVIITITIVTITIDDSDLLSAR